LLEGGERGEEENRGKDWRKTARFDRARGQQGERKERQGVEGGARRKARTLFGTKISARRRKRKKGRKDERVRINPGAFHPILDVHITVHIPPPPPIDPLKLLLHETRDFPRFPSVAFSTNSVVQTREERRTETERVELSAGGEEGGGEDFFPEVEGGKVPV
jgi:hypothetical protein